MENLSEQTVKGYELTECLGKGAYGAVYRAFQPQIGREAAIMIILPAFANQPDFIHRYETDDHLMAQLEHLHIVPLDDYWREPDGAYLVMQLLKRGSLSIMPGTATNHLRVDRIGSDIIIYSNAPSRYV